MNALTFVTTLILVTLVTLTFFVQEQLQVLRALDIKADFNLKEIRPSFQTGHILYNLKNIYVTGTTYPTEFVPSMGEKSLLDVDPDQVFLQGTLVTHTTPQESNISNVILALPIDTMKNHPSSETITTDKNRGWVNLNGHLTFGTLGMISIDKIRKQGTLLISTNDSVVDRQQ